MINLLPPEKKEELFLEKVKKLVKILGITVLVPLFSLILILLSMGFYILAEANSQKVVLQQDKKTYETPDFLSFRQIIQDSNKNLTQLDSFYHKELYATDVLKIISTIHRPDGLYLSDFSLMRDKSGKFKVAVSGSSKSRDDLIAFKKSIEANQVLKNPYFSPQSWVDPQNVRFSLTFEVSK